MNLALFDFDGTITSSDSWTPFMRMAVRPVRIRMAMVALSPIVVGYRLGMISASRARQAAARVGFSGEPAGAIRQLGAQYAATVLPGTLQARALERIDWHKSQGDDIVVVSASLDLYLTPWCAERGLKVICTTIEEQRGTLTGRYVDGDCSGAEKVRRIRAQYDLSRYPIVYAYGDSGEDREMMALADKKYYRWKEITSWDEVSSYGHPDVARADS
jgi:HAD superfamily hydrolase (TIGR01490 family)